VEGPFSFGGGAARSSKGAGRCMTAPREQLTNGQKSEVGGFLAAKEGWLMRVASYPNLSGADLAVAIVISKHLNTKTNDAWPSMETLARDTNRERSTVWRALERLESFKLIQIQHSRSRRKPNRYRPQMGELDVEPKTLRRSTTPRGSMLRTGNINVANSQRISCEPAALTLEEELSKL
jgi:hypothetical protein